MTISRRDHLVDTALRLFNLHGYHATGIDMILREAGVAKMTLYNHFKSKEDLIIAVLERRGQYFGKVFQEKAGDKTPSALEKIWLIVAVAEDWFRDKEFSGCLFLNGLGEYSEEGCIVRDAIISHKNNRLEIYAELARDLKIKQDKEFAHQLMTIFDGAITTAEIFSPDAAVRSLRELVALLLEKHLPASKD